MNQANELSNNVWSTFLPWQINFIKTWKAMFIFRLLELLRVLHWNMGGLGEPAQGPLSLAVGLPPSLPSLAPLPTVRLFCFVGVFLRTHLIPQPLCPRATHASSSFGNVQIEKRMFNGILPGKIYKVHLHLCFHHLWFL